MSRTRHLPPDENVHPPIFVLAVAVAVVHYGKEWYFVLDRSPTEPRHWQDAAAKTEWRLPRYPAMDRWRWMRPNPWTRDLFPNTCWPVDVALAFFARVHIATEQVPNAAQWSKRTAEQEVSHLTLRADPRRPCTRPTRFLGPEQVRGWQTNPSATRSE